MPFVSFLRLLFAITASCDTHGELATVLASSSTTALHLLYPPWCLWTAATGRSIVECREVPAPVPGWSAQPLALAAGIIGIGNTKWTSDVNGTLHFLTNPLRPLRQRWRNSNFAESLVFLKSAAPLNKLPTKHLCCRDTFAWHLFSPLGCTLCPNHPLLLIVFLMWHFPSLNWVIEDLWRRYLTSGDVKNIWFGIEQSTVGSVEGHYLIWKCLDVKCNWLAETALTCGVRLLSCCRSLNQTRALWATSRSRCSLNEALLCCSNHTTPSSLRLNKTKTTEINLFANEKKKLGLCLMQYGLLALLNAVFQ